MKEPEKLVITHEGALDNYFQYLKKVLAEHGWLKFQVITPKNELKQRTKTQNNSFHQYCEDLAVALREAGYEDMRTIVKVPISPTKENVKTEMCHKVMFAMFPEKESSADLSTVEMCQFYDQMNLFTSERLGVSVPWPSRDEIYK